MCGCVLNVEPYLLGFGLGSRRTLLPQDRHGVPVALCHFDLGFSVVLVDICYK